MDREQLDNSPVKWIIQETWAQTIKIYLFENITKFNIVVMQILSGGMIWLFY